MDVSQYLSVFMDECQEHLSTLNQSLLALENEPENSGLLDAIFRAAHTLKGASATMGFNKMSNVTHTMEDILSRLRSKEIQLTPEIINALFDGLDLLEELSGGIAEGKEEDVEVNGVIQLLRQVSTGVAPAVAGTAAANSVAVKEETEDDRRKNLQIRYTPEEKAELEPTLEGGYNLYHVEVELAPDCVLKGVRVFMVLRDVQQFGTLIKSSPSTKDLEDENFDNSFLLGVLSQKDGTELVQILEKIMDVKSAKVQKIGLDKLPIERRDSIDEVAKTVKIVPKGDTVQVSSKGPVAQTVRVDIQKLDKLMNLLAELVIARSRLDQIALDAQILPLTETVEHVGRLTSDLRDQVLKTRMVPIDNVFSRFPRMIRDLAKSTGKEVELVIKGKETELDRTVIDEIGDPLVHILRNSVDHGIELPDVRKENGKPSVGTVNIIAFQQGNNVVVKIADDGKGINVKAVGEKAVRQGLLTAEELAEKTDDEIVNFIFMPGFSTAAEVTDVSGRGVGMDVVRTKIKGLGGTVQVSSEYGKGTTITIMLPLTLAIIQTLLVQIGEEVYAIPSGYVDSTISVDRKEIKLLRNQEVTVLRGQMLPLVRLQNLLEVSGAKNPDFQELDVVVISVGDRQVGYVVDALLKQQDVVIKSLGVYLKNIPGVGGATILGDGRVALILDFRAVA